MSWIYLIVAGLFEVAFTSCMGKVKETTGSEMYWWFTGFIISMSISMFLLIKATQALPIGTAYAVWTGIGAKPPRAMIPFTVPSFQTVGNAGSR